MGELKILSELCAISLKRRMNLGMNESIILKRNLQRKVCGLTEFSWLEIMPTDGLLGTQVVKPLMCSFL
jgi:hypothetical protein